MDEALRILLEAIHGDILEIKKDVKAQNGRVRVLEVWRGWITGAIAVIVAFGLYKTFL